MATTKVIPEVIDLNQASSTTGLKMPSKNTAYSGPTVAEGMMRNEVGQTSQSSASCMQHYNGTDWKNFDNLSNSTLGECNYPTTATALYQFQDTENATCGPNPFRINNLTYATGVPRFGATNKAVVFNGSDSAWNSSSSIVDVQQDFSISVWFNLNSYDATNYSYLATFFATGDAQLYVQTSNKIGFNIYNNTSSPASEFVESTTTVSLNTWYHVAYTWSGTNGMELFINGTSEATNTSTKIAQYHGGTTPYDSIGCYGDTQYGDRAYFDGQIDQFRAFQSILSQSDIDKLLLES